MNRSTFAPPPPDPSNSSPIPAPNLWTDPVVRNYAIIGLAALGVYYLVQMENGGGIGTLLPVLVGVPGLLAGWTFSPLLFLWLAGFFAIDPDATMTAGSLLGTAGPSRRLFTPVIQYETAFQVTNLLTCLSVLVYLLAQYRLMSLVNHALPEPNLRRRRKEPRPKPLTRPSSTVSANELPQALLTAGGIVLIALIFAELLYWLVVASSDSPSRRMSANEFHRRMWLGFIGGGGLLWLLLATLLDYLRARQQTPEQAAMFLQDQLWWETQREQRRQMTWREWARRR